MELTLEEFRSLGSEYLIYRSLVLAELCVVVCDDGVVDAGNYLGVLVTSLVSCCGPVSEGLQQDAGNVELDEEKLVSAEMRLY